MARAAEPQRALFLNRLPGEFPAGVQRLYFGAEFCPWAMPAEGAVLDALTLCRHAGLPFTLATPVVTEPFLPRLQRILEKALPLFERGDELLISDLGVIAPAREISPDVQVILGRVLSGQKRGPEILELDLPPEAKKYFQASAWSGHQAQALLAEIGIARIELDNLLQGNAPLPAGLRGSLHHPYLFVTSSRNCPFQKGASTSCSARCAEVLRLESPRIPRPLLQRGNTQFTENHNVPVTPLSLGIDRLVYHPVLPR